MSAEDVRNLAKELIASTFDGTSTSEPYFSEIDIAMQKEGLAMASPIFFADTNWDIIVR